MTRPRYRLAALIIGTMSLLAILTTAETQDLTVTPAAEVTAVADATPTPAVSVTQYPNSYATWACGATRQTEEHTLQHAHVVTFNPAYLLASCQSQAEDMVCFWNAILWWNGATSIADGTAHCVIVG